ncbi:MAG: hypothetical protein GY856_10605, partial [bacterium]|nr:hypothetical protein [bacterium]
MTTEPAFDAEKTRRAIVTALPRDPATHGHAPEPHDLYVPLRHFQALSPEHGLVVGIRGAGKSVWWAALQSEAHRRIIADAMPRLDLDQVSAVDAGFGEPLRPDDYPDPRQLRQLLAEKRTPTDVWRTVIAWHTWGKTSRGGESALTRVEGWNERVDWIVNHPEEAAHAFTAYDDELAAGGRKHLVLFDALDRAASDWQALRRLLRGLIEILLELRR